MNYNSELIIYVFWLRTLKKYQSGQKVTNTIQCKIKNETNYVKKSFLSRKSSYNTCMIVA